MLKKLIEWEKENGYKSKYVAKKLGLSESKYSKIKQGKLNPPVEMAEKLVEVFNVPDVFELLKKQ